MNSNKLKAIAIITMLIDHVGYVLFPDLLILRVIGRLSFPIFTFLIAEGYYHTKDINKYMLRLGVFALISEIPFDLAFHGSPWYTNSQNIFFTLFLGLLAIRIYDHYKTSGKWIGILGVIGTCMVSFAFKTDYYVFGVLIIFAFNGLRNRPLGKYLMVSTLLVLLTGVIGMSKGSFAFTNTYQIASLLSLGLIYLYNGKPGMKLGKFKMALYIFYPAHLWIIYFLNN